MDKIFELHKDFDTEHNDVVYDALISVLKEKEVHDLLEKRGKVAVEKREEKMKQIRKAHEKKRAYNLKRHTAAHARYNEYKKQMEEFRQPKILSFTKFNNLKKKAPEQIIAMTRLLDESRKIVYEETRDRANSIPAYVEFVASKKQKIEAQDN